MLFSSPRGPLDRSLGRAALDRLGVHVGDDVLGERLGGLAVRRAGVAGRQAEPAGDAVRRHHRILVPHLVLLPDRRRRRGETLLRDEPLLVVRRRVHPGQELLRGLLVLGVRGNDVRMERMHGELARRASRQRRVQDVGLELRALIGLVLVGLAQRLDIDRGAVQRRADRAREEGAVVVGVVPGEAAFVVRFLPERGHEAHRLHRLLGVERELALLVDLLAAERPQVRIAEGRRIAESVAERLADRPALGFELLAGVAVLLPGFRKLVVADVLEPGLAVGDLGADHRPRHRDVFLAVVGVAAGELVVGALRLGDGFGDVAHVGDARRVELRMVVVQHHDVGAGAGLDRRGDARLQVVGVDGFEVDLDAERLGSFGQDRLAKQLVRGRNEVVPADPVHGARLREDRRLVRRENSGEAAAGQLQKPPSTDASHAFPPPGDGVCTQNRTAIRLCANSSSKNGDRPSFFLSRHASGDRVSARLGRGSRTLATPGRGDVPALLGSPRTRGVGRRAPRAPRRSRCARCCRTARRSSTGRAG